MRRSRSWWMAVVLLCGPACAGEGQDDLPLVQIDDGHLTLLSPDDGSLWDVRDVLEADRVIWALKASPPFLHGYDVSGRPFAAFGTTGQGPGELRYPRALWPGDAVGSVTVWDAGSSAALTLSEAGKLLSTHPMPRLGGLRSDIETVTFGHPFRLFRTAGATVMGRFDSGVSRGSDLWRGQLVRVIDPGGSGEGDVAGEVLVDFQTDLPGSADRPSNQAPGLVPVPLWDGCPDGRIAVLDPISLTLLLFSGEDEAEAIRLPWEPPTLQRREKLEYIRFQVEAEGRGEGADAETINRVAESALAHAEDLFPQDAPAGVDLKCAPGRVWIQGFDGDSHPLGYGRHWRTVSLDGSPPRFARVVLPPGFQPLRVSASEMLGVVTDHVSMQRLARLELPPPLR